MTDNNASLYRQASPANRTEPEHPDAGADLIDPQPSGHRQVVHPENPPKNGPTRPNVHISTGLTTTTMSLSPPSTIGEAIDQLREGHQQARIHLTSFEKAAIDAASSSVTASRFHAERIRRMWKRHLGPPAPQPQQTQESPPAPPTPPPAPKPGLTAEEIENAWEAGEEPDIASVFDRMVPAAARSTP